MEEILASIRQIIADDPSSDPPETAIEANPLVPSRESRPAEPRPPLADRLSDVLKGGSLPPTSPLGSKRPLSFDQDLADMFDEGTPVNGGAVVTSKPHVPNPHVPNSHVRSPHDRGPATPWPTPVKPFIPPMAVVPPADDDAAIAAKEPANAKEPAKESGNEQEARAKPGAVADGAAAVPPQLAPSGAFVPPLPFGGGEKSAEPAPATTYGFPPLRKTSFYPPQPKAPVPPRRAATTGGFFPSQPTVARPEPAAAASPDAARPTGEVPRAPRGPGSDGVSETGPFAAGPRPPEPQPASTETLFGAGSRRRSPFAPSDTFAASHAPAPISSPAPISPASVSPTSGDPVASPFGTAPGARPIEPRLSPDPFPETLRPAPGYAPPPRLGAEPELGANAAHQALDALALGLAASAAHATPPMEEMSPAIPLTPVRDETDLGARAQPAPSTLPAPRAAEASFPVNRTLEDAVADMLRPMLQQWVAENMPRIIERALRTEVAQIVQPGTKPPGA